MEYTFVWFSKESSFIAILFAAKTILYACVKILVLICIANASCSKLDDFDKSQT